MRHRQPDQIDAFKLFPAYLQVLQQTVQVYTHGLQIQQIHVNNFAKCTRGVYSALCTSFTVISVSLKCIWILYTFVEYQLTRPPFPRVAAASAPSVDNRVSTWDHRYRSRPTWFQQAHLTGVCGINRNRRQGCRCAGVRPLIDVINGYR